MAITLDITPPLVGEQEWGNKDRGALLELASKAGGTANTNTWTAINNFTGGLYVNGSPIGSGDMVLASIQSVTGLKTFDKDKLAMKGTSTGVNTFSVANTSSTNYTNILPAKDGTFAMTSDITGINSGTNTGDETADTILSKLGITTLSGSNTGDQTSVSGSSGSCTGNSATATNLIGGNGTTLFGSIPYQSNTDTTSFISPNTLAVKKYLTQTGVDGNGTTPVWDTISELYGDITVVGDSKFFTANFGDFISGLQFKNKIVNGDTVFGVVPNGTATQSEIYARSNSSLTSSSKYVGIRITPTEALLYASQISGAIPLSIFVNGSNRMTVGIDGNVSFTGSVSATNISGTNTGDETKATIESKLTGTITSHNHSGVNVGTDIQLLAGNVWTQNKTGILTQPTKLRCKVSGMDEINITDLIYIKVYGYWSYKENLVQKYITLNQDIDSFQYGNNTYLNFAEKTFVLNQFTGGSGDIPSDHRWWWRLHGDLLDVENREPLSSTTTPTYSGQGLNNGNSNIRISSALTPEINGADKNFSISIWFKKCTIKGALLVCGTYNNSGFYIFSSSGTELHIIYEGTELLYIYNTTEWAALDTNWHNLVLIRDSTNSNIKIFVDSVEKLSLNTTQGKNGDLYIGKYSYDGQSIAWNNEISNVIVYTRVINQTEVNAIYNAGVDANVGSITDIKLLTVTAKLEHNTDELSKSLITMA